jgi:cation diffusion facilitator CzcD-associated flavoprotein CzcO
MKVSPQATSTVASLHAASVNPPSGTELSPASGMVVPGPSYPTTHFPTVKSTPRIYGRTRSVEVAIIGAGPYGLSIAAHLRAHGVEFRIFGNPMEHWRARMPAGMLLKSEGFASDLYDPERRFTLRRFCLQNSLPYADMGVPIPRETLATYGLSFQAQLVPDLENKRVVALDRSSKDFLLQLDDGETLTAHRVIVAVGNSYFQYLPASLSGLPAGLLSHSSEHHDLSRFAGQDVTVVGGGASALDLAALLHEIGSHVHLVARRSSLVFLSKPGSRSLWHKIRYPMSGIGGGWRSRFFADAPMLFRYLPQQIRLRTIKTYLGPAGAWFVKDQVLGHVPLLLAHTPAYAEVRGGRVYMQCQGDGMQSELVTDHVIAATGYRVDIGRLDFLSDKIRASVLSIENAPVLSRNFESSVRGLYFVGLASAHCFGPVMRFLFGAGYTARRLSEHLSCDTAS